MWQRRLRRQVSLCGWAEMLGRSLLCGELSRERQQSVYERWMRWHLRVSRRNGQLRAGQVLRGELSCQRQQGMYERRVRRHMPLSWRNRQLLPGPVLQSRLYGRGKVLQKQWLRWHVPLPRRKVRQQRLLQAQLSRGWLEGLHARRLRRHVRLPKWQRELLQERLLCCQLSGRQVRRQWMWRHL